MAWYKIKIQEIFKLILFDYNGGLFLDFWNSNYLISKKFVFVENNLMNLIGF